MARSAVARVPGSVRAPALARRFAAQFVAVALPSTDVAATPTGRAPRTDIATIVSELVTNAVRAGARMITVALIADAINLRIEVSDDVAGWPLMRQARHTDADGRGLPLVAALADDWGVRALPGTGTTGKQVWARLAL